MIVTCLPQKDHSRHVGPWRVLMEGTTSNSSPFSQDWAESQDRLGALAW